MPMTAEFKVAQASLNAAKQGGKAMEEYFRELLEEWVDYEDVNLDDTSECLSYLYYLNEDLRDAYMAEYETIVQFQLIILQLAKTLQDQEKKYIFKFISEKRAMLYLVGINVNV